MPNNTDVSILTNGTLLNEEILGFLKQNKVSLGISIDGSKLAHNNKRKSLRNTDTYSLILEKTRLCRNLGIDFGISSTLTWDNINNFETTIHTIVDEIKPSMVGFNLLMDKSCKDSEDKNYADRAADFMIKSFKVFREEGLYEDRMMRKSRSFVSGTLKLFDCAAAGGNQIVILPDGQIGICQAFIGSKKYFVSNVFDPFFDPKKSPDYLDWSRRTPFNMNECLTCKGIGICGGGCPSNAYNSNGSIWAIDKKFCSHNLKTLDFLIWDLYSSSGQIFNLNDSMQC